MEFTSWGKLVYDPEYFKNASKPAPWWLIVETDKGIVDYYNYLISKRIGIKLLKPSWGSHISVIRGERINDDFKHLWKQYDGIKLNFKYTNKIDFNEDYWWVNVECDELMKIREELGLSRRPFFGFHITVGKLPFGLKEQIKFNKSVLLS